MIAVSPAGDVDFFSLTILEITWVVPFKFFFQIGSLAFHNIHEKK